MIPDRIKHMISYIIYHTSYQIYHTLNIIYDILYIIYSCHIVSEHMLAKGVILAVAHPTPSLTARKISK